MKFVFLSQGNMDQFSMLLDHDADPSMGLDKTGRNLLHLLATMCTEHDLRRHMKIVLKKVRNTNGKLKNIYIEKKGILSSTKNILKQIIHYLIGVNKETR